MLIKRACGRSPLGWRQELKAMETSVRAFFERYESSFNRALKGDIDR
jgi:hypothetical protein